MFRPWSKRGGRGGGGRCSDLGPGQGSRCSDLVPGGEVVDH